MIACSDGSDSPPIDGTEPEASSELSQQRVILPSRARPAYTPGSEGVVASDKLQRQFGSDPLDLNQAIYLRYFLSDQAHVQPDAIIVAMPGFVGGAANFAVLAENLMRRARQEHNQVLELWAIDRRSNQLEDTVGLDIAEDAGDPQIGVDFLFGDDLGLELGQALAEGPGRRAVFYDNAAELAFLSQWTTRVHTLDLDAVVEEARSSAREANVFLAGHSAGTGFAARYAASNVASTEGGDTPGYRKLRGLILLEGGGARPGSSEVESATLDQIEARFDGGLHGAIRDQAPRCIDGATSCTSATADRDCAAFANRTCVQPVPAFASVGGLLSPALLAVSEPVSLDIAVNGDGPLSVLQVAQGGVEGNTVLAKVPELAALGLVLGAEPGSSASFLGQFLDDDGVVAGAAGFLATSVGFAGPAVEGVVTWLSPSDGVPDEALVDNGPAPEAADDVRIWGVEREPSDLEGRMIPLFYRGQTNFSEWYYPSSGLAVTAGLGFDSSPLSAPPPVGRGRTDIVDRTHGHAIDVPVIAFGGSNGLTPTAAVWLPFAGLIAPCAAPSCDGSTGRVIDPDNPSGAFPSFGEVAGGFEVYLSEGYAHVDVLTAEDEPDNNVVRPLVEFIQRNSE